MKQHQGEAHVKHTSLHVGDRVDGGESVRHAPENLEALAGLQVRKGIIRKDNAVHKLHEKERCANDVGRCAGGKDARDRGEVALEGPHDGGFTQNAVG